MSKKTTYILFGIVLIIAIIMLVTSSNSEKINAMVYKSPTCGCCGKYVPYLEGKDFDIDVKSTSDMNSIKTQYGVPSDMESCHTVIIGNYFVEGHVPIKAINKLLEEQPDIDGISLPNMPAGSPGMPGIKSEDFIIYQIKDGMSSEFMRL